MKFKKLTALFCTAILLCLFTSPALANTSDDEIGAATTIFQDYLTNGAIGEIRLNTNVAGKNPEAQEYISNVLDLSTRLVPFSLDASMTYYTNVSPTTFFVTFRVSRPLYNRRAEIWISNRSIVPIRRTS